MALRLAGEEQSQVLGLDSQGWVREVRAPDGSFSLRLPDATTAAKGIKVGSGPVLFMVDGGTLEVDSVVKTDYIVGIGNPGSRVDMSTGALILKSHSLDVQLVPGGSGKIDALGRIYNSGAGDGGAVALADALRVQGAVDVWDSLDAGAWQVALNPTDRAVWFKFKTADQDPSNNGEGVLYLAEVAGVRKLVAKVRSGGAVYTGALSLT